MALTSAVANAAAAAAAAAGAGKKAAQVQLQAELNTDDEWNKFIARDGLLVDVYSEWCGPCQGMVGNLKKIKVELGGDNLHLAVAKSDTIACLKRFRKRSEPTWMFISSGQLIQVVFGADAPRIVRTIEQELRNQELVKKGELVRIKRAPHELTPPEKIVADAQAKLLEERRQKEIAAVEQARLARREARAKRLETHFVDVCPGLMLAHAQKHLRKVSDALEPCGVIVADKCPIVIAKDGAKILGMEEPELATEGALAALLERPSLALLLKRMPDKEGDVIEMSRRAIYGDGLAEENRPKKLPADELRVDNLPGIYIPADRHQRAAILDLLFPKMVGALVEPAAPAEPPHVAMVFGAWQRRAVLATAALPEVPATVRRLLHLVAPWVMRYGFFADGNLNEPRLLCKNIDQYEQRPEKDYGECLVLMMAVGAAEPEAGQALRGAPPELLALGPAHVSAEAVCGGLQCARCFPPGYTQADPKPKPKGRKKKKKRQEKEESSDGAPQDAQQSESAEGEGNADAEGNGEGEEGETEGAEGDDDAEGDSGGNGEGDDDDHHAVDKATSPPPLTPH